MMPGVQIGFIFMNDIGTTFSHIASMIRTPCVDRNECSLMQHRNRLQA
jgi:L-serine deaminase